jgi:hypothetical protein
MASDLNSKLHKRVRRELVRQGCCETDALAARMIRQHGLERCAEHAGVKIEKSPIEVVAGKVEVGGVELKLGDQIIVEGVFDVLRVESEGYRGVVPK